MVIRHTENEKGFKGLKNIFDEYFKEVYMIFSLITVKKEKSSRIAFFLYEINKKFFTYYILDSLSKRLIFNYWVCYDTITEGL